LVLEGAMWEALLSFYGQGCIGALVLVGVAAACLFAVCTIAGREPDEWDDPRWLADVETRPEVPAVSSLRVLHTALEPVQWN
jgi:hypothetical protein